MTPEDEVAFVDANEGSICHQAFDAPQSAPLALDRNAVGLADAEEGEEEVIDVDYEEEVIRPARRRPNLLDDDAEDEEEEGNDEEDQHQVRSQQSRNMDRKVRDHDHITGKYRGAAHDRCNLRMRTTYKIPVFFHNFRGYDAHLIVKGMANFPQDKIRIIGQSLEKYMTLSWGDNIVFKDSYLFMAASLETLAHNLLAAGKDKFIEMKHQFRGEADAKLDLLLRKGVYPYAYMNDWDRLDEHQLPPRASFFNALRQSECSEEDYAHAQNVWQQFGCQTMKDYHELYLKTGMHFFFIHALLFFFVLFFMLCFLYDSSLFFFPSLLLFFFITYTFMLCSCIFQMFFSSPTFCKHFEKCACSTMSSTQHTT